MVRVPNRGYAQAHIVAFQLTFFYVSASWSDGASLLMLSVLPSQWCSIVTNSIGADFVVGHSLSQPEVVKSIRFGFESKKGTTYRNVFAIGLTLLRFIRFGCILAINSGSR